MRKTKVEKGITLVALIITIIVLLLLAVVAINAVRNDGIIDYAKNARYEYEEAQRNEQSTLDYYLSQIEENDPETIKRKEEETAAELELLKRYVLGENKAGRVMKEVVVRDSTTNQVTSFIDEKDTIENENDKIKPLFTVWGEDKTKYNVYAKYNNKVYKITIGGNSEETDKTKAVKMIYEQKGREGDWVKYDSDGKNGPEDWIIITDRDGKVEIVSANVMYGENNSTLTLGSNDTSITVTSDLDGNRTIGNKVDVAIASYNNAITTINNYCKSLVTATNNGGVRSVGGTNNSAKPYTSANYENLGTLIAVDVASGDIQFEDDIAKLYYHGIADVGKTYWIASRFADEESGVEAFCVRTVNGTYKTCGYAGLWALDSVGEIKTIFSNSFGVRTVVINPSGI